MRILSVLSVIGLLSASFAHAVPEKLSPQMRPVANNQGYSIDIAELEPFIGPLYIMAPQKIAQLPMINNFNQDRLLADTGDDILVNNINSQEVEFDILEAGEAVVDPDTKNTLGILNYGIAKARMIDYGKISKLRITSSLAPIYPGYRLMPTNFQLPSKIQAYKPNVPFFGKIIALPSALSMKGDYQQVVLNIGKNHGVSQGMILSVYSNELAKKLAEEGKKKGIWQGGSKEALREKVNEYSGLDMAEPIGEVLIYSPQPGYSFGLILSASKPIHRYDLITTN